MEVRDGFIEGIFNYCDRWCDACEFTSWCRLFTDQAEIEASLDPQLKELVEAPPLPLEAKELPPWIVERLEGIQDAQGTMTNEELGAVRPPSVYDGDPLLVRATAYAGTVHHWLESDSNAHNDPNDPRIVIGWFSLMIPAKIARALQGVGYADFDDPEEPTDYDGSAKVALASIERSRAAWQELAPTESAASQSIAELTWLEQEVERMFPRARRFIRPAFDEPDEVARLLGERNESTSG